MGWLTDLLALPRNVKELLRMAEKTDAAVAELNSAVDEMASELEGIAADADEETAAKLTPISERLRGLYTPPEEPPAEPV